MRFMLTAILLVTSRFTLASCDFDEVIPESWLIFIPENDVESHIEDFSAYSCEKVNEYLASVGEEQRSCEKPYINPPILNLRKPGDAVAYFASPENCRQDSTQPLYGGYALFRAGKQIGFELRVGTHNKALKWDAKGAP